MYKHNGGRVKMINKAIIFFICFSFSSAAIMQQGEFYKEKQELIALKKELNEFYDKKEAIYKKQKKELKDILAKIQIEKKAIEDIKKANQKVKDEITREITSRSITMYDKMKVKVALDIFKTMVADGKINEVFDIMIRLKQKRVLTLLKKFDVPTKTLLMQKMKKYDYDKNIKEKE